MHMDDVKLHSIREGVEVFKLYTTYDWCGEHFRGLFEFQQNTAAVVKHPDLIKAAVYRDALGSQGKDVTDFAKEAMIYKGEDEYRSLLQVMADKALEHGQRITPPGDSEEA